MDNERLITEEITAPKSASAEERVPIFSVRTQYTIERLMDLNISHVLEKKWLIVLLIVCSAIVTQCAILDVLLFGSLSFEIGICCLLMLGIVAIYVLRSFIIPRFAYKKTVGYMSVHTVDFYEKTLVTTSENGEINSRAELFYTSIVKVRETRDNLFLFLSANEAAILSKADVEGGDYESLIAHIRKRCTPKAFVGYKRAE